MRLALVLTLLAGGCTDIDVEPPPLGANLNPEARLRAPVIAPVGLQVAFDAAASFDPDGDPLTYIFGFGDGTAPLDAADPEVTHLFQASGLYTVQVRVLDVHGNHAVAQQDVSVRDEYPEPPNFCAAAEDCTVGDECDGGVCYTTGGAVE